MKVFNLFRLIPGQSPAYSDAHMRPFLKKDIPTNSTSALRIIGMSPYQFMGIQSRNPNLKNNIFYLKNLTCHFSAGRSATVGQYGF